MPGMEIKIVSYISWEHLGLLFFMCTSIIVLIVAPTVVGWSSATCFMKILQSDFWEYSNKLSRMVNLP